MDRGRVAATGTTGELKALAGERSVLELRAIAFPAEAVEAVRQLPGVLSAVSAPVGEAETMEESLRVHCEDASSAEAAVGDALRARGVGVSTVDWQEPSLEDAFIALTGKRIDGAA
jgi:ABC-type multidrug transport system ATPase subunit